MIKYKPFGKDWSLAEIGQKVPHIFAFMSDKNEQCHPFVRCRDFLQDAARAMYMGKAHEEIYGFKYNPSTCPAISLMKMRMLVKCISDTDIKRAIKIINIFEQHCNLPLSVVEDTQDEDTKVFIGPRAWMTSPYLVSMYTFLIRLGYKNLKFKTKDELQNELNKIVKSKNGDNDTNYLISANKYLFVFLEKRKLHTFRNNKNFAKVSIGAFHNHSGIWSLSKGSVYPEDFQTKIKKELLA